MSPWFLSFVLVYGGISQAVSNNNTFIPDAIQLIYTTHHNNKSVTYHINEDALDTISTFMKKGSFEVISAIGQARKGKSYTLSKMVQKMSGTSIIPFKSSDFNQPYTRGIWMYILVKCSSNYMNKGIKAFPCSKDNKQYIILDIQGSYTETDDESMRFATIVTLISSQTFLFLHQKLYKHDIDQIRHIQTFITEMNQQNIEFDINDINLGAIIREPFKNEFGNLEKAVNTDLSQYAHYFEGFGKFVTVQQVTNFNDKNYNKSIENIIKYISINKKSRMEWSNNADKLRVLLTEIIDQFNNNQQVSAICIVCVFKRIVEWEPYTEFGECSKKCNGGIKTRYRDCNTGNIDDCKKHIGGSEIDKESCNTFKCEWLAFGEWSDCSRLCEGGKKIRERKCSTGNIQDCVDMFGGSSIEEKQCNLQKCKWVERGMDHCSVGCGLFGAGIQKIHRYCESGNDRDCDGDNFRIQPCGNYSGCFLYLFVFIGVVGCCGIVIYGYCRINKRKKN